jgi:hypothetical protein
VWDGGNAQLDKAEAAGRLIPPTKRQQLTQKKQHLELLLKNVNDALAALDEHPELEKFSETLARAL